MSAEAHPITLDGRYFVVRSRLWRHTDPFRSKERRAKLVATLMAARRAISLALRPGDAADLTPARADMDDPKTVLGDRRAV